MFIANTSLSGFSGRYAGRMRWSGRLREGDVVRITNTFNAKVLEVTPGGMLGDVPVVKMMMEPHVEGGMEVTSMLLAGFNIL